MFVLGEDDVAFSGFEGDGSDFVGERSCVKSCIMYSSSEVVEAVTERHASNGGMGERRRRSERKTYQPSIVVATEQHKHRSPPS